MLLVTEGVTEVVAECSTRLHFLSRIMQEAHEKWCFLMQSKPRTSREEGRAQAEAPSLRRRQVSKMGASGMPTAGCSTDLTCMFSSQEAPRMGKL